MKKHLSYFDLLRVIASFFVVLMHTSSASMRYQVAQRPGWFLLTGVTSLTYCAVPLFFMMSGYLLTASDRTKDVGVLLRERLPRLVVPLAFWSALYILWNILTGITPVSDLPAQIFQALQSPVNVSLWFMYTLVGMYLISPVLCTGLRELDKRGSCLVLGLIVLLELRAVLKLLFPRFSAAWLNSDVLNDLTFFSAHLCSFILGWYLGGTERRLPRPVLALTALALWGIITLGTIHASAAQGEYVSAFQAQNAGFETLLAACIFLLAKETELSRFPRLGRVLRACGVCTFPIYLMHNLLLKLVYPFCKAYTFRAVMLIGAGVYLAAMAIAWVFGQIPGLSFLACGLKAPMKRENTGRAVNG